MMVLRGISVVLCCASLSACAQNNLKYAKYWQRIDVTEAVYLNGPQAQSQLNRDIASCVKDVRQIVRNKKLREAIPPTIDNTASLPFDDDQLQLNDWDTPERDHALFLEHYPYQNFESCMKYLGWRRTEFVPSDVMDRSHINYFENMNNQLKTNKQPPQKHRPLPRKHDPDAPQYNSE